MKKINLLLTALFMCFIFSVNTTHASFPVKPETTKEAKKEQVLTQSSSAELTKAIDAQKTEVKAKNTFTQKALEEKWILVLLWFFLGGFAAHRWYKGKPTGINILFILTAGGCGIWALIDLINILTDKF